MAERGDGARRARRRRRRWPWFLLGALLVAAWVAAVAMSLLRARTEARAGIDRLEEASEVITPVGVTEGEGVGLLEEARGHFAESRDAVQRPWIVPLRVLPIVGRQVRSVDALTTSATEVVDIGLDAVGGARDLLKGSRPAGARRVELARAIGDVADEAVIRLDEVDLGPDDALFGALDHARRRFAGELGDLQDAAADVRDAARGMAEFLEGPSTYLLLAANNNEMRVGSGTYLSAGLLTVRDGEMDIGDMTSTGEPTLPPGTVPLPGDAADRWGWLGPSRNFRQLAAWPRFDTQGPLAVQMATAGGLGAVDGVLVLDPVALQALLEATGPVEVEGQEYRSDNVLEHLYLEQYRGLGVEYDNEERRDGLGDVARAAVQQLDDAQWRAVDLVDSLRSAAGGRHIMAWAADETEQRGWAAAAIDGHLEPESVFVGVHNTGANKLDQFLSVEVGIDAEAGAGSGTDLTLPVRLANWAPEDLPEYVEGPFRRVPGSAEGLYQGLFVIELPLAATDPKLLDEQGREVDYVAFGPDQGSMALAAYVEVPRGAQRSLTVTFGLPEGARSLRIEPSARKPEVVWEMDGTRWEDDAARTVEWSG